MKKILYIIILFPVIALGQSNDQNYKKVIIYKEPTSTSVLNPNMAQATQDITYYDGLGRPTQQISGKQSLTGNDIVTHIEYDAFGRKEKDYLPYVSTQSNLIYINNDSNALVNSIISQYQIKYGDINPYSKKEFQNSPLNRVLKQAAPGSDWIMGEGHEVKFQYQTNDTIEVKLYKALATWSNTLQLYDIELVNAAGDEYYKANELYKTIIFDENNQVNSQNFTVEYKDKDGRIVLKRTNTSEEVFDTYYIYDYFGNLTYVIPPLVATNNEITQDILDGLCYQYKYDNRNRLVEKKLPGKQWEFIVYNLLDKPVASGPAYNPIDLSAPGWLITKYDKFERVTLTGWYGGIRATSEGRLDFQNIMNQQTHPYEERIVGETTINGYIVNYTDDNVYPKDSNNGYTILTVNYYDDYLYNGAPDPETIYGPIEPPTPSETSMFIYSSPKGLLTGSWVRILNTGPIIGEMSYSLYDSKSRVISTYKTNYLGGFKEVDYEYDFIGKILQKITKHKRISSSNLLTVEENFTYTAQDRLLTHTHKINADAVQLLARNEYDEFGQLIVKRVGGTNLNGETQLQKIDYTYNIRGWLKNINDITNLSIANEPKDLFAFKINYNDVENETNYTGTELFNGNVSETYWRTANDNILRKYGYQYDYLNRLVNSIYQKPGSAVVVTNSYNESLSYDKMGNITKLKRSGEYDDPSNNLLIDDLTYSYSISNPNQLDEVSDSTNNPNGFKDDDAGNDYKYDSNGNMILDRNKDIKGVIYNHLNLPNKISFAGGNNIIYIYNALGEKILKRVENGGINTVTDYLDGFQYVNDVLEFFPHAEGYVKCTLRNESHNFNYAFNYTDHLGNIRLTYGIDPYDSQLKIMEENNYYPFGLKHKNYNVGRKVYETNGGAIKLNPLCSICDGAYKYKYQGQERQDELGLNWDSFKWRNYDYAIGRFMSIDPLAEKYAYNSPYAFQENKLGLGRELEGLELVPRDGTFMNVTPASVANERLANENYTSAPYRAGTTTGTYTTDGETTYSRVYTGNNVSSRWVLDPKDIEGLTPEQIQAKFALPETPTNIVDVVVPSGTGITEGEVGPNFGFDPPAGTMQYEIRDIIPKDSFTNSRVIPDIMPVTPEPVMPMPEPVIEPIVDPVVDPVLPEFTIPMP